jgi:hypothetical protein
MQGCYSETATEARRTHCLGGFRRRDGRIKREFCVVNIKKKDWMKWRRRLMALNRIEGVRGDDGVLRFVVRGGDGMLRFVVKYLAIFYAFSTAEATATAPMSGSNFGPS